MGFFSKLLGKSNWKKTLIRDLVTLTAVDGDMDKEEIVLAHKIAIDELGFTEQEFIDLMENLGEIEDVYPIDEDDKFDYIQYLIQMTYSDGYVDDNEVEYMKIIAKRMNLPESSIDKVISYIEESSEEKNNDEDVFCNDESINKIIITSPYDTMPEVQTPDGFKNYHSKISELIQSDVCIELSNVLAAKHNLMLLPSSINKAAEKQKKVTDLTDKVVIICMQQFGQEVILSYGNRNIRKFNELVNMIDAEVAQLELGPFHHGNKILEMLNKNLK